MRSKSIRLIVVGLFIMQLAACHSNQNTNGESKKENEVKTEKKGTVKEEEPELTEGAAPEKTYKEVDFQNVTWGFGTPDREAKGGVWIYTKEKHPKKFDTTFKWDTNDVLLVQINNPKYKGNRLIPKKLQ